MARIRTIKPEFWSSGQIVECSSNARLLFIGLWNFCDDSGIHKADAARLRMEVFPGDPIKTADVRGWIDELLAQGLIHQYSINGDSFWQVTGWKHQKIDKPFYRLPLPDGTVPESWNSTNTSRTVAEQSAITRPRKGVVVRREGNIDIPTTTTKSRPLGFDEFWSAYPRKVGKGDCEKWWRANKPDAALLETMLRAIDWQRISNDWKRDGGTYIPHPRTWLNAKRWLDEKPQNSTEAARDRFLAKLSVSEPEGIEDEHPF